MDCPPGSFRNPYTGRCVKYYGRQGQRLLQGPPRYTRRQFNSSSEPSPRYVWVQPARQPMQPPIAMSQLPPRQQPQPQPKPTGPRPCPPGSERNPQTGRCLKMGTRRHRAVFGAPPKPQKPPKPQPIPEPPTERLPLESAAVAPIADRPTVLGWIAGQCKDKVDAITGIPFASNDLATLQGVIRLHDGTCVLDRSLDTKVHAEHRAGTIATIPGDPTTALTVGNFDALRTAMRRRNPDYKIPGRRHRPPPPNWHLFVTRDSRSGPDFASVTYVDSTKRQPTPTGYVYPPRAIMIDLGFIPTTAPADAKHGPQIIVQLLDQVARANRLLEPVPGGWKPIAGFPFTKRYWNTKRTERLTALHDRLRYALEEGQ